MTRSAPVGPRLTASLPACAGGAPTAAEAIALLRTGTGSAGLARSRVRRLLARLFASLRAGKEADAELRLRMEERLRELRLPLVAAVAGPHDPRGVEVTDLAGVLAILTRTSAGVFLAEREPDLALATPGRSVTLVLPEGWEA